MNTVSQHIDGNGNVLSGSGDVQSNSFDSHGGTQNIAQGTNPIGQQNNYYLNQPAPPPVPRQPPAPEPCFLRREEELVWLNERLHPGKVAAVCGPGGMGKSALAAQAVHRLEEARFPDGIIFHSFYHQPSTEQALQAICQAFQVEAKTSLESAVRQVLSGRRALLILDGTEQADDLPALLRLRGSCGVLITSRKRTDALADRLDLKPLDEQPAAEVFRLYNSVAADDPSVAGICTLLGGWPVALRIAGRYISSTGESAADYLQWLAQEPFKELAGGEHQEENAALLLRRSVDAVSAAARLALNELVNYGLLERKGERWQVSHALVHTYARTELALSKDALERLAASYISFCRVANAGNANGYALLDAERAHCLSLTKSCLASELWQEVKALVGEIREYLDRQGYWADQLTAIDMRLTAAQQAGDYRDEGLCLNDLGYTCELRGEREQALRWYEQSLSIARELDDRKGKGVTLHNMAAIYGNQGKHELALQHYEQSLSIHREIGDRKGEGATLNNIGMVYYAQGNYEQALSYYEQTIPIRRKVSDEIGVGQTLNNIAAIYHAQGDLAKALEHHEQALAIRQQLGDRAGEAISRGNIGATYIDLGDLAKAEECISQAVRIEEEIGHPDLENHRKTLAWVRAARRG